MTKQIPIATIENLVHEANTGFEELDRVWKQWMRNSILAIAFGLVLFVAGVVLGLSEKFREYSTIPFGLSLWVLIPGSLGLLVAWKHRKLALEARESIGELVAMDENELGYPIAIVDFPLPESFKEACDQVDPLVDQDVDGIKGPFQRFHDELKKIYPCSCDRCDGEADDSVWSEATLLLDFTVEAPIVDVAYSEADEAVPKVIALAHRFGFSVLDWQSKSVHNPQLAPSEDSSGQ
jgi:hypothetical protein